MLRTTVDRVKPRKVIHRDQYPTLLTPCQARAIANDTRNRATPKSARFEESESPCEWHRYNQAEMYPPAIVPVLVIAAASRSLMASAHLTLARYSAAILPPTFHMTWPRRNRGPLDETSPAEHRR
jgi:hypothetical protein